jgi:hypothetical protein
LWATEEPQLNEWLGKRLGEFLSDPSTGPVLHLLMNDASKRDSRMPADAMVNAAVASAA